MQKEVTAEKDKISFLEKKYDIEGYGNLSEQETEIVNLTSKLSELEIEVTIERDKVKRLAPLNSELNTKIANFEELLDSKTQSYIEEKSNLTSQLAESNEKNARLELENEKLKSEFHVQQVQKDPKASTEQQNNASLAAFGQTFNTLLKNIYLGYEGQEKNEEQLLEELDPLLLGLPDLKHLGDLYLFIKERSVDLKRRYSAVVGQRDMVVKSVQQKAEELEKTQENLSSERKAALVGSLDIGQLERQEITRKLLEKVGEFSIFYESMVKSLFTTASAEGRSGRRNSTAFIFKLEAAAQEYKQLLPLLSSYKFLDGQIKKELFELRQSKVNLAKEQTVAETNGGKPVTKSVSFSSVSDKQLEDTLREFGQYFVDLLDKKIKGSEKKERIEKLQKSLAKLEGLEVLQESFPVIRDKLEEILRPRREKDQMYEDKLAEAKASIKKLCSEVELLHEKLTQSKNAYNKIQETLSSSSQSISNFGFWMSRVEEACLMLGGVIHDLYDSKYQPRVLAFELKPKDKEERLVTLSKEIPEIHELAQIAKFLKGRDKNQLTSPKFSTSPRVHSPEKEFLIGDKNIWTKDSVNVRSSNQLLTNILTKPTTDNSFLRNLSFETNYAFSKKDRRRENSTEALNSRLDKRMNSSVDRLGQEKRNTDRVWSNNRKNTQNEDSSKNLSMRLNSKVSSRDITPENSRSKKTIALTPGKSS